MYIQNKFSPQVKKITCHIIHLRWATYTLIIILSRSDLLKNIAPFGVQMLSDLIIKVGREFSLYSNMS